VTRLNVAGIDVVVEVTHAEMTGPISEIFRVFDDLVHDVPTGRRAIVGLAGLPGSGKSTLATLLAFLGNRVLPPLPVAAVSIDGWHWPNARLDQMTTTLPDGRRVPLRERKGSPESFDVEGIVAAIRALREAHVPARLPAYDRRLHEPVADAITVAPGTRVVILEGNYVLCRQEPWRRVAERLDMAMFLDVEEQRARESVILRHVVGGLTREQAEQKYERNDRLNAEYVIASRRFADVLVRADDSHRLTAVQVVRRRVRAADRSPDRFPISGHRDPPG